MKQKNKEIKEKQRYDQDLNTKFRLIFVSTISKSFMKWLFFDQQKRNFIDEKRTKYDNVHQ